MKTRDLFDILAFYFVCGCVVTSAFGYVTNLKMLVSNNETIWFVVARACGIFMPPLGVVLGFL